MWGFAITGVLFLLVLIVLGAILDSCWHRWTKWEEITGNQWAFGFHGKDHSPSVESRVCVKCGEVEWRVVK